MNGYKIYEKYSRFYLPMIDLKTDYLYVPNNENVLAINENLYDMIVFYKCCAQDDLMELDEAIKSPLDTKLGKALYE